LPRNQSTGIVTKLGRPVKIVRSAVVWVVERFRAFWRCCPRIARSYWRSRGKAIFES